MQADVGMKKKERARLFLALAPSPALSPNLNKTLVRTLFEKHDTHILQGQKCEVHTPLLIGPKPFFSECRVNRLAMNVSLANSPFQKDYEHKSPKITGFAISRL